MANSTHHRRTWPVGRRLALFLALLLASGLGVSAAPALRATLDRDTITLGESVTLSLVFDETAPAGTPNLPALPNLTVSGVNSSRQETILNGVRTTKFSFNYALVPSQPGDIMIPAMQVVAGGQALVTQPLVLHVLKADPASAQPQLAFLKLIVPKTNVYLGEPLSVEIQLYWQNAQDLRLPQLKAEGFSLGQSAKPTQTRTQIGNTAYNLAFFKLSVTPARTGALILGPAESSLTLLIPVNNQRRDPIQSIFGGGNFQGRAATLTSETVTLNVLPLPADDVPPGFNGAVGTFQLAVTAGPTNVPVGDPITVKAQIAGTGLLDALNLPAQADWRDFTSYPPSNKIDSNDPLGLTGVKSFEQVVIPQNHEIKALPPLVFSYFDPNLKSYRTLSSPPIPLTVRPTAAVAAPPSLTNTGSAAPPPVDDIFHIRARLDEGGTPRPLLAQQPWFLSLQAVPLLAWLSLLFWRRSREALANNPKRRRQREVAVRVRDGLKQLRAQAAAQQPEEFYATLFRLLQEQLGERLDLPASSITEAVIDERLRGGNLSAPTLTALHELFQTCNLARYAPTKSSQELTALIPKLEAVGRELQHFQA